ncbi:MAG: rhodanese-like domain-containing protein [Micavibrio aeruginosavorus]|uniref:Rhodanese-like domain-containing protein n=1 Tax=Micavibrio aeruginosavorus TaxID=349221 RepID=A0A7T5R1M3_9BACT|nr:MAG: rhodanese-like domain-containing protein [Micavibrio aeruginosavorus]
MRKISLPLLACLICSSAYAEEALQQPVTYKEFYEFANQVDDKAHTLTVAQFKEMMSDPEVIIADLRSKEAYDQEHIKGAVHLGPDITLEKLQSIAPSSDKKIIMYCANSLFQTRMVSLTDVALPQALYLGYKNTYILERYSGQGEKIDLPFEGQP